MPEAPEVKLITEELDFFLCGRTLVSINIIGGKYLSTPLKGLNEIRQVLPLTFESVSSKGKMLIFKFKNSSMRMFAGLGMNGEFKQEASKYSHIEYVLNEMEPYSSVLYFNDSSRYGNIFFTVNEDLSEKLAPSVLDTPPLSVFLERIKNRKCKGDLTKVLLDQNLIFSGIGNYLLCEICYEAKLDPCVQIASLSQEELIRLYEACIRVPMNSYKNGGTLHGRNKSFLKVYMRTKTDSGDTVLKKVGSHKRTLWYVPVGEKHEIKNNDDKNDLFKK